MIDVFVLVSTAINVPCARVWSAVIDFQLDLAKEVLVPDRRR